MFSVRDGRLVDGQGRPFLSLGLNHVDATNLKYPHNIGVWRERYGDRPTWIRNGALHDLAVWGFNTLGWTQDWVAGEITDLHDWSAPIDCRHSEPWSAAELRSAGVPYTTSLRVQEFEDWNGNPRFRPLDDDFEAWCDYLARTVVTEHSDSPDLLGYFFVDIPSWVPRLNQPPADSVLGEVSGTRLYDLASRYYETMTAAVRRYDRDHLILGDRYNGDKDVPDEVLRAMSPFVDVLSVQYFGDANGHDQDHMVNRLAEMSVATGGKPVLLADIGNWTPTAMNPGRIGLEDQAARGRHYRETLDALVEQPWFVGMHWCGYLENDARGWGIKDPYDDEYSAFSSAIAAANADALAAFAQRI